IVSARMTRSESYPTDHLPPSTTSRHCMSRWIAWTGVLGPGRIHLGVASVRRGSMVLQKELARFDQELPQILKTIAGQFVLLHGDDTAGPFGTENEAYEAGCARYGPEPFLVMLVDEEERPTPMLQNITPYADSK